MILTRIKQWQCLRRRKQARKVRSADTLAGLATRETRWTERNLALAEYVRERSNG